MNNNQISSNSIPVEIINGFVKNGTGGNPAGVVLDADRLSEPEMLSIAANIGLSETAFISSSKTAGFKFDFFTPVRRIAHCGHATIAAFSYLAERGIVTEGKTSKETVDGSRDILIKNGAAYMEQLAPEYKTSQHWQKESVTVPNVLHSLGLTTVDLKTGIEPMVVNTGNSFMIIAVQDGATLSKLSPDFDLISNISEKLDLIGFYVFTTDNNATDHDATTRMFAPRYGITEESATGMAAGPLACFLHDHLGKEKSTFSIEQGNYMQPISPSLITVELNFMDGQIQSVMAGGHGKVSHSMTVNYQSTTCY